jgi:hypothetical protein
MKGLYVELISITLMGINTVILLLIAMSYTLAYKLKRTFSVGSFAIFFWSTTVISFLISLKYILSKIGKYSFITNGELFFIIICILSIIPSSLVLYATWRSQNGKD